MSEENQRVAERYRYRCYATVLSSQAKWEAHLLNISESGALVGVIDTHDMSENDGVELLVEVNENEFLNLVGTVMHVNEHYVGMRCEPRTQTDFALLNSQLREIRADQSNVEAESNST